MSWPARSPFVASLLEQAFWLGSMAVAAGVVSRETVLKHGMEMCLGIRARAKA